MSRRFVPFLCLFTHVLLSTCSSEPVDDRSIDDLPNPGRGWSTHSSFDPDAQNRDYPASTIAYFRFTWRQAEPTEGGCAFDQIDALIAGAKSAGQRFAFRIEPDRGQNGLGIPDWLLAKGVNGWHYTGADGSSCFSPDAADAAYMTSAHALIAALGARYNGHPDIDFVDIGLVGDYGEWHFTLAASLGAAMPPFDIRTQYIDWHFAAFPDTHLVMLVGGLTQTDSDALSYAVSKGAGWRADSWGDYRWPANHMEDDYPRKLEAPGVSDAWRSHPVVLETCGTPQDWYLTYPERLQDALDFAVTRHASVLNAKSSSLPDAWIDELAEFTRHIGYRFALASPPTTPESAARGTSFRVSLTWTNLGNAPIYRPYVPAVRLVSSGSEVARGVSTTDVRTWMPHSADAVDYPLDIDITLPADAATGVVTVQAALLDPGTNEPAIRLAMEGGDPDLWYDAGSMIVR